jgi:hypothetical protein
LDFHQLDCSLVGCSVVPQVRRLDYAGVLKNKILDELGNIKELRIEQRKEAVKIMEFVLS